MSNPLSMTGKWIRRLVNRETWRGRTASARERSSANAELIFETLEQRLLLAADPLGITAGYAFDEVSGSAAADASGSGIVGTLTNGATFTAGNSGNAVALDGVDDFVDLGNPAALQFTGSMTISAWVYVNSFPADDGAIVSKRASGETGYQLDITPDTGFRTIGFKLTNSSGGAMFRYGATPLQVDTWYHIAGVYDAANQTLNVYLNGALDNGQLIGTVTGSQQNSTTNVDIGRRAGSTGFEFAGRIDDVRIADHALTQDQIQTDMATPLGGVTPPPQDTTPPSVSLTPPPSILSGTVNLAATASDDVGVAGVEFLLDANTPIGVEDTTSPYGVTWDTATVPNGVHTIVARARDAASNSADSAPVTVTVSNTQVSGLVTAYSFDEAIGTTANDSSGQGNTATLVNGIAWVPGQHGTAASFDGTNDYITIPSSPSTDISGSALTLSMWINPQPLASGDSVVIGKFWNTTMSSPFYQYGLELGGGNSTNFFVGTSGGLSGAFGGTTLAYNQWTYLAITFDGAQVRTYVNGTLANTQALAATVTARGNPMNIGADASVAQFNKGLLDDLRIYNSVLTQAQIQADMATPVGGAASAPQVAIGFPANGAQVSDIVNVTADATDETAVSSVQFFVDGVATGSPDTTSPYALAWDTRTVSNGAHTLTALATDVGGHSTLSAPVAVNVANASFFQNEILATGFDLPTSIRFLPDGRMLVVELAGTIKLLPPPYTTPDPTPFLQLANVGSAGVQQGIYDIALDPDFATNHHYYIFYTAGTPNVDRLSRFTANATLTGTVPGSELVLYQDAEIAHAEHHGGAINFSNDGTILLTTGEHFDPASAQDLTKSRGKILRFNSDGTVPTDNPFHDGAGPNFDAIWALGLRNPFRAYYDAPTGRLIVGDVGGNNNATSIEEINIGARGANYGWPDVEGTTGNPAYTSPVYSYSHDGRDASITAGFVYHGTQFPGSFRGSFFFGDYTQNWIKRLTFDANGSVTGVFNFEPADGAVDGPYGDIVSMTEGPEGALYYVDLGYSDIGGTFGVSKIRRISFIQSDLPPVVAASASPTQGSAPLTVSFSSSGSSDPEGGPLSYSWDFGDGSTPSTEANPSHAYAIAGPYQARLTVSDGVNSTFSTPIAISVGNRPVATISSPTDGALFRAGDVIAYSGTASDAEDGTLPASAYTWNIDFLHEGHVHPGTPTVGMTGGTFAIPTTGHDFSGFTRYRITLTVTDSSGLQSSQSVTIFPEKVDLTFDTAPTGLTLYVDGIAHATPFTYDTLAGFNHEIEARDATVGTTAYTFASWSDGGAQGHVIVAPAGGAAYAATYTAAPVQAPLAFVQVSSATPQTNQSQVSVVYTSAQVAGDTNILAIGWNNATSSITSVTDSAGNVYQLAVPTARGDGLSQAIYYAENIKSAAAGANTVTVTFDTATAFIDLRALEYSGLDLVDPFDVGASASGIGSSASSGAVTTSSAHQLVVGAGMTTGAFSAAGAGFTTRIITSPDQDIAEDQFVTATGSYSAAAALSGSAAWVMQVATFKALS